MPQCVYGARRPSHRSSQVPPPHSSMALPLSEIPCLHASRDKAMARFLWEPRPRGEYRDCFGDVVDMPQCVFGAGRPSHRSSQVPPPYSSMALRLWEIPSLHARPDKAVVWFLWEHPQGVGRGCKAAEAATTSLARPRGDYRDCFGDVVDMPRCVFGARRPSHRSSQVPPPNPLSLPDSGVLRNDGLKGWLQ